MKTIEELKKEANELGLTYNSKIGATKLSEKIEDYYESQSAGDLVKVKEEIEEEVEKPAKEVKAKLSPMAQGKVAIKAAIAKSMKTRVVTISNNDKRDNSHTTTAYLSCGAFQRTVPLDIPVELENALINIAKNSKITQHIDEVVGGKRTGNKIPKPANKYMVSYEDMKA